MTDAPRPRVWRSGRGPCAGPRRNKPRQRENGETTFGAVDRGPVRANNGKPVGSHRPLADHHELPEAAIQSTVGAAVLLGMAGMDAGQGTEPPGSRLGSCADSWLRTIIANASEARRLQSAGGSNSTRGRVLILPLYFWRISRSGGRES